MTIFYSKKESYRITSPFYITKRKGETELIGDSIFSIIHIILSKNQEIKKKKLESGI